MIKQKAISGLLLLLLVLTLLSSGCNATLTQPLEKEESIMPYIQKNLPMTLEQILSLPYPSVQEAAVISPYNQNGDLLVGSEQTTYNPFNFDFALARFHGLIGNENILSDDYLHLQAIYRAVFFTFINKNAVLSICDEKIANHQLEFVPLLAKRQDIYQRYGSYGNRYIFIRNNFYIERLNAEDLSMLKNAAAANLGNLLSMVARTYRDVINPYPEHEPYILAYEHGMLDLFYAPTNALVLKIRYNWKFDASGMADFDAEKMKQEAIARIRNKLQSELAQQLNIEVVVSIDSW